MTEQDYEVHYEPAEPTAVTREAADVANQVTHAIYALKTPPPTGSEHYRSGWDTGLEAAADTARDAVLAATASQAAENARLRAELDEAREQCTEMEQQHRFALEEAQGRIKGSRAAVLREAAAIADHWNSGCQDCATELELRNHYRRMADEAQQAGEGR